MKTNEGKVKKHLTEKSRYKKETGESVPDFSKEFLSKITPFPCEYGFTMTNVEKIGIFPKSNNFTPLGVYFYPLNEENYKLLILNGLPYASGRKFVGLVKFNMSDKSQWLLLDDNLNNQSKDKLKDALKYTHANKYSQNTPDNYTTDMSIYDMIKNFSFPHNSSQSQIQIASKFTNTLKKMGYIGVYDNGNGMIHSNERSQCVALTPAAYTIVGMYERQDILKSKDNNGGVEQKTLNFINNFVHLNSRRSDFSSPGFQKYVFDLLDHQTDDMQINLPIYILNSYYFDDSFKKKIIDSANDVIVKKICKKIDLLPPNLFDYFMNTLQNKNKHLLYVCLNRINYFYSSGKSFFSYGLQEKIQKNLENFLKNGDLSEENEKSIRRILQMIQKK